jgi:AraC-like DNA-binding protein
MKILQDIFGKNIFFERDENAIYFKKDELNTPVNNSNPAMLGYFEAQANTLLSLIEESSWFSKTEKEILKNIGDHAISVELVASNLDISVRTLQNYLKAESKSFSEALTNVRSRLAKHYILNTKLDDGSISILLGYSEVSSFYRAYKKWSGATPKELRQTTA